MTDLTSRQGHPRWLLGLLFAPAATLLACLLFPSMKMGNGWASALTFFGGVLAALAALGLASHAQLRVPHALGILGASVLGLGAIGTAQPKWALLAVLVNTLLVALAHATGHSIGVRVANPGHLLPACLIAALADLASVLSPSGPTHAIANSERAMGIAAIQFPVPSVVASAPVLGVGDLIFVSLLLGTAFVHRLSLLRMWLLCLGGVAAAGLGSALFAAEVPALIPIALAVLMGEPQARVMKREDRKAAKVAVAIALAVALGVVLKRLGSGE